MIEDALTSMVRPPSARPWYALSSERSEHLMRLTHTASKGLLAFGAVAAAAVVVAAVLAGSRPGWWSAQEMAQGARQSLASTVDNNAWTIATKVRPMTPGDERSTSEPWSVLLTGEAASAWLNEKLPQWLTAQERPLVVPENADLRASFDSGKLYVGLSLPDAQGRRFLSLTVSPRIDSEGLWLPAIAASVGRLDLPPQIVLPRSSALGETAPSPQQLPATLAAVLAGETPALPRGAFRLPDGRSVRVLKLEAVGDRLLLTMQTESAR